jgi:hypothetical protein
MLLGSDLWWGFDFFTGLERSPQIVTSKVSIGVSKNLYQARLRAVAFSKICFRFIWAHGVEGGRELGVFEAEEGKVCEEEYAVGVRPVARFSGLFGCVRVCDVFGFVRVYSSV